MRQTTKHTYKERNPNGGGAGSNLLSGVYYGQQATKGSKRTCKYSSGRCALSHTHPSRPALHWALVVLLLICGSNISFFVRTAFDVRTSHSLRAEWAGHKEEVRQWSAFQLSANTHSLQRTSEARTPEMY